MKAFLDTSVLVAAFYGDHQHHALSLDLLTRLDRKDGGCGAHSLIEVYSTLTRMPGRHRVSGEQAMLFIADVRQRLTVIALDAEEIADMLAQSARLGLTGGAIYDALLAHCALKGQARTIYTWNLRHYQQCGVEVARLAKTP